MTCAYASEQCGFTFQQISANKNLSVVLLQYVRKMTAIYLAPSKKPTIPIATAGSSTKDWKSTPMFDVAIWYILQGYPVAIQNESSSRICSQG